MLYGAYLYLESEVVMFVKFLINSSNGAPIEEMYECESTVTRTLPDNENHVVLVLHKNDNVLVEKTVDKRRTEVYFMNSNGRTVDSWRWGKVKEARF